MQYHHLYLAGLSYGRHVRPFVCPSVTRWYSVNTTEQHAIFTSLGVARELYFFYFKAKISHSISQGNIPMRWR